MKKSELKALIKEVVSEASLEKSVGYTGPTYMENTINKLTNENKELKNFVREFVDAWEEGLAGDSSMLRKANAILEKYK
jgi:hemerythrin-like domain-containing protein